MKKHWLSGLVARGGPGLAGAAPGGHQDRRRRPDHRPERRVRRAAEEGVEQAVEDINKAGGILGQKITLEVGDDVSDPKQGVSVANKFVGDGVKLVVGHFNSGVTIPASDVYADNGMLMITPSATNPKLTEGASGTCSAPAAATTSRALVGRYIVDKLKGKKIAILHDKTTYGKGLADETEDYMQRRRRDGSPVRRRQYRREGLFGGRLEDQGFRRRLVYWGGLHTEGGLIVRQMRDQGVKTVMMSGDGITVDEFATIGGPGVVGTLMTFGPDPRKRPERQDVVKEFAAKNFNPEAYTLYSYAAVQIMKQAAEKAEVARPQEDGRSTCTPAWPSRPCSATSPTTRRATSPADYVLYVWKKMDDGKITYKQQQ